MAPPPPGRRAAYFSILTGFFLFSRAVSARAGDGANSLCEQDPNILASKLVMEREPESIEALSALSEEERLKKQLDESKYQ